MRRCSLGATCLAPVGRSLANQENTHLLFCRGTRLFGSGLPPSSPCRQSFALGYTFLSIPKSPRHPPLLSVFSTARRWFSPKNENDEEEGTGLLGEDVLSSLEVEHQRTLRQRAMPSPEQFNTFVSSLIPNPMSNTAAIGALKTYFTKNKVNEYIPCEKILITHITQDDGTEIKADKRPPMSITEALDIAKAKGLDLVMMAENKGVAFCKVRNERQRAVESVQSLLVAATTTTPIVKEEAAAPRKKRDMVEYEIREVITSDQLVWRSKKIVGEIKKGHPVKIKCARFLSPEGAIAKIKEFLSLIKKEAMTQTVGHSATNVGVSEQEINVILTQPNTTMKEVKHPSEEDWRKHLNRFMGAFNKSGRENVATMWVKDNKRSIKRLGSRFERVDKYGNVIEDQDRATDQVKKAKQLQEEGKERPMPQWWEKDSKGGK